MIGCLGILAPIVLVLCHSGWHLAMIKFVGGIITSPTPQQWCFVVVPFLALCIPFHLGSTEREVEKGGERREKRHKRRRREERGRRTREKRERKKEKAKEIIFVVFAEFVVI